MRDSQTNIQSRRAQRSLEILPGLFSWSLILFPFWGSLFFPVVVAYYVIAFDVYWLYRSISTAILAVLAHFRMQATQSYDWLGDIVLFPDWKRIHHIIVLPTYKEPLHTLRRTLKGLKKQTFPRKQITVVVSFEKREGKPAREKAKALQKEFASYFANFLITFHPDLPGEVAGKSSNTSWAAKFAKKELVDKRGYDINYLTITSEDADAVLHRNYLSALTYSFLDHPKRFRRIWQAAIVFYNNIWRVPAPIRVLATTWSVVQMSVLMRRDRLINFSTYSTSMKLVDEIGYWDVDVIPEDYRLFFKAYFHFKGKVDVESIFLPVYADAAESTSYWKTMFNQYEQVKRWAWGVSDDSYIIKRWIKAKEISFWEKTIRVAKVLEDHFLWPVNWFAITLGALLPPLINKDFSRTILGKTLPQVSSAILTLSLISLLVILIIDARQRPPRPKDVSLLKRLFQPFEFILLPIVGFFFNALPGIDAHTRLMLGKYIEYRVTEKV
jgi:cellulose synthase/poly-beta-1,6-N-acetylglucosamine synthase-like glycosyltransferase